MSLEQHKAKVVKTIATDGSELYDVHYHNGHGLLEFGCVSQQQAEELATALDRTAWVTFDEEA